MKGLLLVMAAITVLGLGGPIAALIMVGAPWSQVLTTLAVALACTGFVLGFAWVLSGVVTRKVKP